MSDTITVPRVVVEQALEALERNTIRMPVHLDYHFEAIKALRAALEQPQDHFPDAGNRVPTGWKLVPVEPTKDMKAAGAFAAMDQVRRSYNPPSAYIPVDSMALLSYRAMIAAAPQPQVVKESSTVGQPQPQQPLTDLVKDAFFEGFTSVETYNDTRLNSVEEAWAEYKAAHGIGGEK